MAAVHRDNILLPGIHFKYPNYNSTLLRIKVPTTKIPIVTNAFLFTIAKTKKIMATAQYKGKERIRLFTAYPLASSPHCSASRTDP